MSEVDYIVPYIQVGEIADHFLRSVKRTDWLSNENRRPRNTQCCIIVLQHYCAAQYPAELNGY